MRSFHKLELHFRITGEGGYCRVLDSTTVLSFSSSNMKVRGEFVDVSLYRKYGLEYILEVRLICTPWSWLWYNNTIYWLACNIMSYVAGYVQNAGKDTKMLWLLFCVWILCFTYLWWPVLQIDQS